MNKVFITGKILNEIELVYYSNIPYIKNLEIECDGHKYPIQCCQDNALKIVKNATKNDILQIEGHLGKDKNNNEIIIIVIDRVDIFRNEKTDSQLMNELKDEDNINNCLNQNTKMILSKMNPKHFIAMLNEVSKISSMFNSIIYEEEHDEINQHNNIENEVNTIEHQHQETKYRADATRLE